MDYDHIDADDAVINGAALLDHHVPDWLANINTDTLAVESLDNCVLGQVFGSFFKGMTFFDMEGGACSGAREEFAIDHGFECPEVNDEGHRNYEEVTTAWRNLIAHRLGEVI